MRLVSILIPAYNSEQWIRSTIRSALDQTWSNVEVVVVDDGSTDGTLAAAREFECENVLVIAQENLGACAARNKAMAVSRGTVIQYLDADDLLAPDKIERQIRMLDDGVLCSGEWGPFFERPERARFVNTVLSQNLRPVDWLVAAWQEGLMMQPAAWLLERELAVRAGPWDERLKLDQDGEYFTRVILASREIRFCPGAKVFYRVGNTRSLSWGKSPEALWSGYTAATLSVERLLRAETSARTIEAAAKKLTSFIYNAHPSAPDLISEAERQIKEMGGGAPQPGGGRVFSLVSRFIGWKAAKLLREPYYKVKIMIARLLEKV